FGELKEYISMANISRALSEEGLPKEWAAAQRELKKLLFEKTDFQKLVIENAGENMDSLIYAVQKMRNMQSGECQSLLVKLSRNSALLKSKLESGEGRKVLGEKTEEHADDSALMTSLASYKRLADELDTLVRVKIPENVKAIETARAFGDLSENAEYDAAKLQRSILRKRRSELEHQLATVQAVDFSVLRPSLETVSIATKVTLETADGKKLSYSFAGAFDGKPEENVIAYNTALGKTLLGKRAGETVTLPEGGTAKVLEIAPLDAELLVSLAAEV
ncbi:MAG: GreA/GreB family elongation factor, partial [Lentisphaeria bacterium]|nr:GreA/GreB family elongation factor [Lentisphaeria bacterium]